MRKKNTALKRGDADTNVDPHRLLGFRLPLLSNMWSALAARRFGKLFGLKQLEARVLFVVGLNEAVSLKYIGQVAGIEKAYASRTAASLVEAGMLQKSTAHDDRRSVRLELTAAGLTRYEAIIEEAITRDEEWISVLNPSERRNLHDYLDRLMHRARELNASEEK